jgi:formylglycine-generating enzyme required for sulfatase activity
MGSADSPLFYEIPHPVYLDTFYMDKLEVTVEKYADFLNATGADTVGSQGERHISPAEPPGAYLESQFSPWSPGELFVPSTGLEDHPVTRVTWFGAHAYCEWAGLRLPTEAEWEKAARGTDGRTYPWGEGFTLGLANMGPPNTSLGSLPDSTDGYWTTAPVGAFPTDVSPYGVLDMAGNVIEWVWDFRNFDSPTYYEYGPYRNPTGPDHGPSRVWRGSSWRSGPFEMYSRAGARPTAQSSVRGFRCATGIGRSTSVPESSWGQVKRKQR